MHRKDLAQMHQRRCIATAMQANYIRVFYRLRDIADGETRALHLPSTLTRAVMKMLTNRKLFRTAACYITTGIFAASSLVYAQDSSAPPPPDNQQQSSASTGGWRRVDDPPPPQDQSAPAASDPNAASNQNDGTADPNQPPPAAPPDNQPNYDQQQPNYSQQQPDNNQPTQNPPDQNESSSQIPPQLTIQQGTFITVRINQPLSSESNQTGDAFSATLVGPLVVDGVVVAEPGQTVAGRVTEAKKAGRVEGVARLGLQLTDLTLVDGQQVPIQSQLISRSGPTSVGRDAGAIAGTTALGAAIGAGADWGRGAAIGAGAGAALATIGVLVTRGHPSVIYPEQVLTFRIEAPVTISTEQSPQAFHFVQPNEYDQSYNQQSQPRQEGREVAPPPPPYYGSYYGYPYYYGSPYPYYYGYPYYWGPGLSFYFGPGYGWGGHGYYGRGFYGRGYYGGRDFYGGGGFYGDRGYDGGRGFYGNRGFEGRGGDHGFSRGGGRGFSGGSARGFSGGGARGSAGGGTHGGGGSRR
ncbi:MAG: hypothetical protein ACR2IV_04625 [Bryobacteraceae bacterium]